MRPLFTSCVLLLLLKSVLCDDIYPKCGGNELQKHVRAGQEAEIATVLPLTSKLQVNCLTYEVTSMEAGTCTIPHQTDLPFRFFITADSTTPTATHFEFDVKDVVGGSVYQFQVSVPVASAQFKLKFANQHPNLNCLMNVRAVFDHEIISQQPTEITNPVPSLVQVEPETVFAYHRNFTYLVFLITDGVATAPAPDESFLLPSNLQCESAAATFRSKLDQEVDVAKVAQVTAGYPPTQKYTVWKGWMHDAGTFRVCYSRLSMTKSTSLLTVFGGNPSYYRIVAGGGPNGEVYLNMPLVLRFFGTSLDTRANGDEAKFVVDTDSCDAGQAAAGVPLTRDLGPADDWGPRTTYTDWPVTIRIGGSFTVCYKRRNNAWMEVASYFDLPQSMRQGGSGGTAAPYTPPPRPTNRITKRDCSMAPVGPRVPPGPQHPLLFLTLKTASVPTYFRQLLSDFLCVSPAFLIFYQFSTAQNGNAVIPMQVDCDPLVCGSVERMWYLLSEYQTPSISGSFDELQIQKIDEKEYSGINTLNTIQQQNGNQNASSRKTLAGLLIACVTIVAVVALTVYGVLQYKKNQHHFVQFGIEEDDEEDDTIITVDRSPKASTLAEGKN